MNTAEKLKKIAENEAIIAEENRKLYECVNGDKVDAKSWYDEFWDGIQNYGNRISYQDGFKEWSGFEELNTKYPIKSITLYATFSGCRSLKRLPIVECANSDGLFDSCYGAFTQCENIESIDFDVTNKATTMPWQATFYNCKKLKRIKKIVVLENQVFVKLTFDLCEALEDITIEGTIGQNGFDIHWSTLLSADSLKSIINALSTTTTGLTITLPTTAQANYEAVYGTGSWSVLVATRSNWTIAYA